ncbi:hypothetical protein D3C76_1505600 [compost metagenome]
MHISSTFRCGNHEEQLGRLIVQRFILNAGAALGKYYCCLIHCRGFGMRHRNSAADSGTGLGFTRQDFLFKQHLIIDSSAGCQTGDQFVDRRFFGSCLQIHDHCFFYHQICNSHIVQLPMFL